VHFSGRWARAPASELIRGSNLATIVRKFLVIAALVLVAAAPAQAVAHGSGTGTIRGVVHNTTCYGPCAYPPPPPQPYTGDNLVVKIRSLPDRQLVAKLHPTDGRFQIDVAPGLYRVRAKVRDGGHCWRGQAKKAQVAQDQTTRVRLNVYNACIV
jgi:hypothetical protein